MPYARAREQGRGYSGRVGFMQEGGFVRAGGGKYNQLMLAPFLKMQGCGNDFVVLDERERRFGLTPTLAAALADRRTGIGCDQLITIEPAPPGSGAAIFMRIRNPDGSEAGACGNAARCVAGLVMRERQLRTLAIDTLSGSLAASLRPDGAVEVDMGAPRLGWRDIPLAREMDTLRLDPLPEAGEAAAVLGPAAAASMGNPHVTFFVRDLAAVPIARLGPALERHPLFPERANIGFAQVLAPDRIRLRVFERGAGLTRACGSGACAALVNAHRRGLALRRATVELEGGVLEIAWGERDDHVRMAGPTATVYTGLIDLMALGS